MFWDTLYSTTIMSGSDQTIITHILNCDKEDEIIKVKKG